MNIINDIANLPQETKEHKDILGKSKPINFKEFFKDLKRKRVHIPKMGKDAKKQQSRTKKQHQ